MADRKVDLSTRIISAVAAMAAAFVARKVITLAWTKATGKEPPTHPEDPQVALTEALIWGMVMGAAVSVARTLALRATSRSSAGAGRDGQPPV